MYSQFDLEDLKNKTDIFFILIIIILIIIIIIIINKQNSFKNTDPYTAEVDWLLILFLIIWMKKVVIDLTDWVFCNFLYKKIDLN